MTFQLQDNRIPRVSGNLVRRDTLQDPVDRVEFVVEELCVDFKGQGDQKLVKYEVIYSLFQKKLLDTSVNMVAPARGPKRGYAVRDLVETEAHTFYKEHDHQRLMPQRGTKRHWHLGVACAAPGMTGKIVHMGQATFRDTGDQSTYFGNRKENADGSVEWTSPGLGTKRVQVPRWLKELTSRDVEIFNKETD